MIEVFAQSSNESSGSTAIYAVVGIVLGIIQLIGLWKVIEKTGQPGAWALLWIICYPIAMYPILKATGRPTWWIVLFFIPLVNLVMLIVLMIDLAKSFGKGAGYGVGLAIFGFIFFPMLGFGSARYQGQVATA